MADLQGKRTLVTGAAMGIGRGIAEVFLDHGAQVMLSDIQDEPLAKAAADLGAPTVHCDVSIAADVRRAIESTVSTFGGIDVLVSNAGIVQNYTLLDHSEEDFDRIVAVNLMAAGTGTTVGQAVGTLETARKLEDLPATAQAFRSGQLSELQARVVASAAGACPEAENDLLETAKTSTVTQLKEQCRRVQASAGDGVDVYERIRRSRYFRHWTEGDGALRLDARLTPDDGARLLAAVDARKEKIFAEARAAGRKEPLEACAADALVELARSPGGPSATVEVRVDHAALVRGHTEAGEVCEIPGIGPIPVAVARRLAGDAFLKVLLTDATDVRAVAHPGRTIPARLRTAVVARDPVCVVPECDVGRGLEIDHIIPREEGGPTKLWNLARLCRWHHYLKTHRRHRLGGGPRHWTWTGPDNPPAGDDGQLPLPP